jgi:HEAT repeat protein
MLSRVRESAKARNPEERSSALRALGHLHDRQSIDILRAALRDTQPSVRGAAAAALGDMAAVEAASDFAALLRDPLPAVRAAAVVSLGQLPKATGAGALRDALNDANPVVQSAAVASLLTIGTPYAEVEPTVRVLLSHADPGIRASLARGLGKAPAGLESLRLLLADPLPRPRIAAARVLGHVPAASALPILKQTLRDSDEAVRATAAGAIGRLLQPADGAGE